MSRPPTRQQRFEIECQGLIYQTPLSPPIEEVRGIHLPKKDQVWYRREEYLEYDWNVDPEAGDLWYNVASPEQWKLFDEEIERIHVGDWIMINGIPTYFNPDCYFFHQWFTLLIEDIHPKYKETSLEYYQFVELCEDDPLTLGDCGIKGRRVGLSSMRASRKLRIAVVEDNTLSGIVSKTGTDAYEMYLMVKNGLEKLPGFLTPELAKVTDKEIHIAKQTSRISKHNKLLSADKGKNNRVNWLDTAENAYDGRRARDIVIDEAAKWERVNVQICLSKISDTLLVGGSVGGYVSVFSTVNKGDKGGDNFRKIWDGSDHAKAVNGMTATRLKRFFIAGFKGFYGYIGKYGESIINTPTAEQREYLESFIDPSTGKRACPDPTIGAKEWLDRLRKLVENDPELLAEQVRKYPYVWQEVFKGSNNRCNFDLEALNEHIVNMEAEAESLGLKEMGRQGKFTKRSNGEKCFEDTKSGFWHILEFLKPGDDNKVIYIGNIKCPNNGAFGCAGLDPFAHSKLALEDGSDACIIIMKRYDALDPECSYMPIAMFLGRPNTKPDFFDQLYFGLEYYGIKVLGERAPTDWIDYAKDKKVRLATEDEDAPKKVGFLMCTKRANGSEVYGINPQDKEAREQHLTEMVEYAKFNLKKIKFIALLKDMVNFDFSNRTAYDACMAFGYAIMGLKDWQKIEKVDVKAKLFMKNKRSKSYFQNMGRKDKAA